MQAINARRGIVITDVLAADVADTPARPVLSAEERASRRAIAQESRFSLGEPIIVANPNNVARGTDIKIPFKNFAS